MGPACAGFLELAPVLWQNANWERRFLMIEIMALHQHQGTEASAMVERALSSIANTATSELFQFANNENVSSVEVAAYLKHVPELVTFLPSEDQQRVSEAALLVASKQTPDLLDELRSILLVPRVHE